MAQSRPAPGISNVPDPGGAMWPSNTPMAEAAPMRYGPASSPATAGQPIMRPGTSLPLNTPMAQSAPQLSGGSPAPAIEAVGSGPGGGALPMASQPATRAPLGGGMVSVSGIASVPDPGGTRLTISSSCETIGFGTDTATCAGGDPRAMGSSFSSGDADAPTWSQFNPTYNPNPGALGGSATVQIPGLYPGETPASQVSPAPNPNSGAL